MEETTPQQIQYITPHLIQVIEILSDDDDSDSDMDIVLQGDVDENLLNIYVDIAVSTEKFINEKISKKEQIPQEFIDTLNTQVDSATIIFHSMSFEHDLRADFGAVLQDLKKQQFRIKQYTYKAKRLSASRQAKIEAYGDPTIACYAELSKDGLKTRNRFYKR